MELRVAFWNVENFFHWKAEHGRATGPKSSDEYRAKLAAVTGVIRRLFASHPVDAVGLAEIGDRMVLNDVLHELGGQYVPVWQGASKKNQTGLGLIYRQAAVSAAEIQVYPNRPVIDRDGLRPRYLAVTLTHQASGVSFFVVISHWKSNLGEPDDVLEDRVHTARSLGDLLLDQSSRESTPAMVMGDFNADPFDGVFDEQRLRGRRSYLTMSWWKNELATLYNPFWRFLAPQAPFPDGRAPGFREDRPQTSLAACEGIYDQMLFSKSLLTHPRIVFQEGRVQYFYDAGNSKHAGGGRRIPERWPKEWTPVARGVSDHFPVCAEMTIL